MNEKQFTEPSEEQFSPEEVQDTLEMALSEATEPIISEQADDAVTSDDSSAGEDLPISEDEEERPVQEKPTETESTVSPTEESLAEQDQEAVVEESAEVLAEKRKSIMQELDLDIDTPVGINAGTVPKEAAPETAAEKNPFAPPAEKALLETSAPPFTFEPVDDLEPITDMPPLEDFWRMPDEDLFKDFRDTDSDSQDESDFNLIFGVPSENLFHAPEQNVLLSTPVEEPVIPEEPAPPVPEITEIVSPEPIFMETEESFADEQFRDTSADSAEFQAMFDGEPEQKPTTAESATAKTRPTRKGRPTRKKGSGLFGIPHLLSTCIWLAIILAIGISLGRLIWVCAADILAFGRESKIVTVNITESDSIDDIANKLHDAGLVRYPELFKLYAKISNAEDKIITGSFELDTLYDYHALVLQMSPRSTNRGEIEVLIPEGYSCCQIFQLLEEKGVCTVAALEEYAANGELHDFWFLDGVERGHKYCLEGYLFPDTYKFYIGGSAEHALGKMLSGFEHRFTDEMNTQLTFLNEQLTATMKKNGKSEEYIADHLLTVRDLLTVASLIEKETGNVQECYTISSVIYNRLYNWGSTPAYLNIDATIIYALDGKTDLTAEDLRVDSPYNTYTNVGLTPGPIANPGLTSIQAALKPATTDYYFYVLNPETGLHQFSKTLEEHEKWKAAFAAKKEAE